MKHKFVTHKEVRAEIYKKHPGVEQKVQVELRKLRIAEKIAEFRKNAHLSQKRLAEKIGTTQSVVARMENSESMDFRVSTLQRIASATGGEFKIAALAK